MAENTVVEEQVVVETPEVPVVPDKKPEQGNSGDYNKLQTQVQNQSRLIAGLQKEITGLKAIQAPEVKQPKGSEALQDLEKKAIEREERANQKTIKTSIMSAMVQAGIPEASAKKLLPSMLAETQYEVGEDDEVMAQDGEDKRKAPDFVKAVLLRDDWRGFIPAKKAPDKGSGRPPPVAPALAPNEFGVYSAKAAQKASAS